MVEENGMETEEPAPPGMEPDQPQSTNPSETSGTKDTHHMNIHVHVYMHVYMHVQYMYNVHCMCMNNVRDNSCTCT